MDKAFPSGGRDCGFKSHLGLLFLYFLPLLSFSIFIRKHFSINLAYIEALFQTLFQNLTMVKEDFVLNRIARSAGLNMVIQVEILRYLSIGAE